MTAELTTGDFCASWFGVFDVRGSRDDFYVVSISGTSDVHCTCRAFEFARDEKTCKHIVQVFAEACLWNCQWHDGNDPVTCRPREFTDRILPHPDHACPNCTGPVVPVRIAV